MKGYDIIKALGEIDEEFVKEADCEKSRKAGETVRRRALKIAAACLLFLVLPGATVLAADYFSTFAGDELAFERVEYRGDGIVAIQVRNYSDKVLSFQEEVKLGIFYANEELPQTEGGQVRMEGNVIAPHSSSELIVDLSDAYDMAMVDTTPLTDDWYYLVLTNKHFVFGQNWQCAVDFHNVIEERTIYRADIPEEPREYETMDMEDFVCENWAEPVENRGISTFFGAQENGSFSEGIHIAGSEGAEVSAVADGIVEKTGFDVREGNYIVLLLEEGVQVRYGHLKEVYVSENQEVEKGEAIGTMGATGMATGPNLSLTLYVDGEAVNPLKDYK